MLSYLPLGVKIYIYFLTFIIGLFMGSALNCLAFRISHSQKWSSGRSKCPSCGHVLSPLDLVPLFSWLFLKGRCRYCGKKISPRYPISELILGTAYAATLWRCGLTLQLAVYIVLVSCLFTLSLVDMETFTIPDRFIVIPAVFRIVQLALEGGMSGVWYGAYHALILGGTVLVLALIMDKLLHKESMGGGDIKLLFMLGLLFDIPCSLLLLLIACIVGIVIAAVIMKMDKQTAFPFGPSISLAAFLTLMFGDQITAWYLSMF